MACLHPRDRGKRWLDVPLADRRAALSLKVRRSLRPPLSIAETIEAHSAKLIQSAKALGLEGVIAKRLNSLYEPGRRSGRRQGIIRCREENLNVNLALDRYRSR
jgi:ATP-dependent DNA ligase